MNGYNFTNRVRLVLSMAREEAARLQHEYVGTEHILLGLIREGEGVAAAVFSTLQVDLQQVREAVEHRIKPAPTRQMPGPDLPYTSRAKKVLELAMSEARELNHSYVGTEHLLLGLLREEKGIAAQVLTDAGLSVASVRTATMQLVGNAPQAAGAPGPASTTRPAPQTPPVRAAALMPTVLHDETRAELERLRVRMQIQWQQVRGLVELAKATGTPMHFDRRPDGALELVLGDDLMRAPIPRLPGPP